MTDIDRERAASAALGALTPDEAARLDEELVRDRALPTRSRRIGWRWRRSRAGLRESGRRRSCSTAYLLRSTARMPRSPSRLLASSGSPLAALDGSFPRSPDSLAAAVAAIALVLAVFDDGLDGPTARAAIQGTPDFAGVQGEARLYSPEQDDGVLALDLRDVPSPGPDEHYEIWVLRESAGDRMEAVGIFTPATPDVQLEVRLPGSGEYKAVDISIEPNAGPAEHSGTSLAGGSFEAAA